jgi:hypothetical protein
LLAHGRLFSPGTPASSTTKTGRRYVAEILLKVALNKKKIIYLRFCYWILHSPHFSIVLVMFMVTMHSCDDV